MIERVFIFIKSLYSGFKWVVCKLIYKDHDYVIIDRHSNGHTKVCLLCGKLEKVYYDDGFKYHN